MDKRKKTQNTLFGYFSREKKPRSESPELSSSQQPQPSSSRSVSGNLQPPGPDENVPSHPPSPSPISPIPERSSDHQPQLQSSVSCEPHLYDIGAFSDKNPQPHNDQEIYSYLTKTWVPPVSYKFPATGKRNLKFQASWFQGFPWLAYSEVKRGAFCKMCVVFAGRIEVGKGKHVAPGALLSQPFVNWKDAKECFKAHQNNLYHQGVAISVQNFISVFEQRQKDVCTQLDKQFSVSAQENRKKLAPIIKTVLLCGRECLPLRGHRDSGPLSPLDDEAAVGEGKFKALLRFRIDAGDECLKQHLKNAPANATYTGKNIQNEIIDSAGEIIRKKICEKIERSRYFSILADETADISGTEQFSLCARYLVKKNEGFFVQEDFLKFVPVYDMRGASLAEVLKTNITALGLDLKNVRGLGFDGAANMSGIFNGCAAKFREDYPEAVFVHCASHSLNLAIAQACSVPCVKNSLGTTNKVINFFRASPKREEVLKNQVLKTDSSAKKTRLLKFCETRWVERFDSVARFIELFPYITDSLVEFQQFTDVNTSSAAFSFSSTLQRPEFIVSLVVANHVFCLLHGLTTLLQSMQMDLKKCVELCEHSQKELQVMRSNFHPIFEEAENLASMVGVDLTVPRIVGRQVHRSNVVSTVPEDYYRLAVFIPFIDYTYSQLTDRFIKHKGILKTISNILPNYIIGVSDDELLLTIDEVMNQWPTDVDSTKESFFNELKMWRRNFLENSALLPTSNDFLSSLNLCSEIIFPNTHNIFKIFSTIPVTTATTERTFSTLRYLKSYLRSTIAPDRLNGLALLHIHREVDVTHDEVLNELAKKKRRIGLLL